jgi:diadenosine tetraphosphate (Ap4A) HIT family hydrolase
MLLLRAYLGASLGVCCGGSVAHAGAARNAALRGNGLGKRVLGAQAQLMFEIDPAFIATSHSLGDLALSHARLQADARFPWVVLIPRLAGARELENLAAGEREVLMDEILRAGAAVRAIADALGRPAPKLNVGQLGNITAQLHVHVIARRPEDAAWPAPVWGFGVAEPYGAEALDVAMAAARLALGL